MLFKAEYPVMWGGRVYHPTDGTIRAINNDMAEVMRKRYTEIPGREKRVAPQIVKDDKPEPKKTVTKDTDVLAAVRGMTAEQIDQTYTKNQLVELIIRSGESTDKRWRKDKLIEQLQSIAQKEGE